MIEVLFVNDNLRLPAGITIVMKNIIENCNPHNLHFTIATFKSTRNNAEKCFASLGVNIVYMPGATTRSSTNRLKNLIAKFNVFSLFQIKSFYEDLLSKQRFDIIHSHFAQIDNIIFPVAKKYGVKVCISHSHSSQLADSKIRSIRNAIMCHGLIHTADYCAACSDSAGEALFGKQFKNSPQKIIIKNGIHISNFEFDKNKRELIRSRYGLSNGNIVIGAVGRLNKVKNQTFLLDVIKELHTISNNYKLMIVGDGECKHELIAKTEILNIADSVIFTGAQENVTPFLSAFDIFVMPSLHEGLGIAAIEAQVNGLHCILSDRIPQEVDLTGTHFVGINNNAPKWAEIIGSISISHESTYASNVKSAGYDIKDVCEELFHFYKKICM